VKRRMSREVRGGFVGNSSQKAAVEKEREGEVTPRFNANAGLECGLKNAQGDGCGNARDPRNRAQREGSRPGMAELRKGAGRGSADESQWGGDVGANRRDRRLGVEVEKGEGGARPHGWRR